MPWQEATIVCKRQEFVMLARAEGANVAALARAFGISRKTAYKWLDRFARQGKSGLVDQSRRPKSQPGKTAPSVEQAVVALRTAHPRWGGRKIRRRLEDQGAATTLGKMPAASTVTGILHRHGLIDADAAARHTAFIRFEHDRPNALLQIDFKGHFAVGGGRCHPLTLVDDHSRFSLVIAACDNERGDTVRGALTTAFERYGLPERMTMDNGAPWGTAGAGHDITPLTLWLMRLGIRVGHSRPRHPQTQGKNERFNRTLLEEVIAPRQFASLGAAQAAFDQWRTIYNCERPHEALGLAVPASRYRPSPRRLPATLPAVAYPAGVTVRRVQAKGLISFSGRAFRLPKALKGFAVAIEPRLGEDGLHDVRFMHSRITTIDMRTPTE